MFSLLSFTLRDFEPLFLLLLMQCFSQAMMLVLILLSLFPVIIPRSLMLPTQLGNVEKLFTNSVKKMDIR